MSIVEIIIKKRQGIALEPAEIRKIINGFTAGQTPDYQMSAFLMAVFFQGMNSEELGCLTETMISSGETVDLSKINGFKVDKHSTGGVGDKISLVLAPLVAAAGLKVPMMSGRGLGHTGGTLDKLEAIPGFRTNLTKREFISEISEIGFGMIGQSERIVPADRLMYALRDVTGCVASIPLICSSIMSKKKAEGADGLVLDVKVGKGAFLPLREETIKLAEHLTILGNKLSIRTVAQLTAMDEPLGFAVGNWLETVEAVECLQGNGPADVMAVTRRLGSLMLVLGGVADSLEEGLIKIDSGLESREGYRRFCRMVEMQGGDVNLILQPEKYPVCKHIGDVHATVSGYISDIDAREIGLIAISIGAGREKKDDIIDPAAGIVLNQKCGYRVAEGDILATIHSNRNQDLDKIYKRLSDCFTIVQQPVDKLPLVDLIIDPEGWLSS